MSDWDVEQDDFFALLDPVLVDLPKLPPLTAVLTVDDDGIVCQWNRAMFPVRFASWSDALVAVCHPLNVHVLIRVRA